jgi:hypothetical protein
MFPTDSGQKKLSANFFITDALISPFSVLVETLLKVSIGRVHQQAIFRSLHDRITHKGYYEINKK